MLLTWAYIPSDNTSQSFLRFPSSSKDQLGKTSIPSATPATKNFGRFSKKPVSVNTSKDLIVVWTLTSRTSVLVFLSVRDNSSVWLEPY